ncbi:Stress response protein nst1 [Neocucurbitaria cava]|uniref:Stress response protein NST1 n=1 Tax=Neocucurbitaria cava TaxID=798079 RepID=A0A9W8YKH5_9PLEO|nr:Stress response protein nst1 [Neocucurbitaria cava]
MPPNGTAPHEPTASAVNRKKQKRREKEAAKKAAHDPPAPATGKNGVRMSPALASSGAQTRPSAPQYADPELDEPLYDDEHDFYSDEEAEHYEHAYGTNGHYQQQYGHTPMPSGSGKKPRKKKKAPSAPPPLAYAQHVAPRHSPATGHAIMRSNSGSKKDRIWNTSTQEERERIREFWLSLGEDERKSLVKIEKEAVLRKMKEQQKHSCSCTVCGRKRTAIEEELEVLYDAYYEELEQYAHHQQDVGSFLPEANYGYASSAPHARPMLNTHPPGHYDDDDEDEYSGDEEEEDYSGSDISSEGDYSSEERSLPPPEAADFLQFGSSLQVKGGILTVADDLLKNDGKKFIEMMEQLAERRMQREEDAQFNAHPSMYRSHAGHSHEAPPEEDDFDDEGDEEEGYEDDDYEEDEEDEDDTMTEEQRMEEGRRMFQIFAARMFEQRVLQAYREKVAAERQQRLLEELAEEDERKDQKEAKKAKEAQKRKEKKDKQKQLKAEEKARKDAELAAKEAELKAAEEQRLEEQRKKREEQRKKKEAERKAQEEEKQRKEAERLKRQQEERERQQEAERKAREQKAQEKKAKDDAKRKEREEREAKEKEAREKKAQEDKERKERESKAKADKDRVRKEEQTAAVAAHNAVAGARKVSQPPGVALPPQLLKQNSSTGMPSPHVTPAVPKAPTPSRPRQTSQQGGSHGSSPKTPQVAPGTTKSISPSSQLQNPVMPKSILTKPSGSQPPMNAQHGIPHSSMSPLGPPPGMQGPPGFGMGNMPPGLNGFPGQGSMPGMMGPRPGIPFFPPQPGSQNFRPFPPPGMPTPGSLQMGRGFPMDGPPGFPPPGFPGTNHGFGMGLPSHSRQGSGSFERLSSVDSPIAAPQAQPIQRPAPIQRPSSVKPNDEGRRGHGSDVDDLANHLGSKALLDDEDDIPEPVERRSSVQQHGSMRGAPPLGFGFADAPGSLRSEGYGSFGGTNTIWGTPPLGFPTPGNPWANSPTGPGPFHTIPYGIGITRGDVNERGPGENRVIWLRRIVCSACKSIVARHPTQDGYVDANEVIQHIDATRNPVEPAVSMDEVKSACDIMNGTPNNGGGLLEYKEVAGRLSHIKFVDTAGPAPTYGEIGSPVPSHSVLAGGFGKLTGLGPQGY